MTTNLAKWAPNNGQIIKSGLSDGRRGDTVPLAVGKRYDFHEFGWYMGNVGLGKHEKSLLLTQSGHSLHMG